MKEWEQNLIGASVLLIVGLIALLYAISIPIPSAYRTFLGIPYQVNPEYVAAFGMFLTMYSFGLFGLGLGLGGLIVTYSVYKIEKKVGPTTISQTSSGMKKKFCRYCGTEIKKDASLPFGRCQKCGTPLELKKKRNPDWSKHDERLQPYCPKCGQDRPKLVRFY